MWIWYWLAAISYIVLGIWHKWMLNWFVGPVWLVAVVVLGPWIAERVSDRLGRRPEPRA